MIDKIARRIIAAAITSIVLIAGMISVYADDTIDDQIEGPGVESEQIILPEAPQKLYLSLYGHDDVAASWDISEGAEGYRVYYKKSSAAQYIMAGETTENNFRIPDLDDHVKYTVKVVPYCINETSNTVYEAVAFVSADITTKKNIIAPSRVSAYLYGYDDVKITWSKSKGANGYYVYYKKDTSSNYTYLGSTKKTYYKKSNLADGVKYDFKVVPRYSLSGKNHASYYSKAVSITTLKKTSASISRTGYDRLQLSWANIDGETGYQISRSTKKSRANVIYTYKSNTASKKNLYPKFSKRYYYKVRAYKVSNGKRVYGPWSTVKSYTLSKDYYPSAALITKNDAFFDVRKEAGQELYGYDIFQGSCTDGQNGYYILYNKAEEKCKIAKVNLGSKEIVAVSDVLDIHHGNDLTYNSRTKTILAVHMTEAPKTIAVIDPVALKVKYNKTIAIPSKLSGATSSKLKKITGFNAIAYDSTNNRYVLRIRNTGDYLITNSNLKPIKYVTPSVKKHKERLYAGLDIMDGYIASVQASSDTGTFSRYNVIQLHTWSGKYKGCINVRKGYEMQSVFNLNGKAYAAFYHEYYENGKLMRNNYIYEFAF